MKKPTSSPSRSVYRNQNAQVRAIFERASSARKVLCVALDYAKSKHVALCCDGNGDILKNTFPVDNNTEGVAYLCEDIALTDRGFNSYEATAQLKNDRGVDSVMRLHQRRKVAFRRGKRLGDHDRLQTWVRPQRPKNHHMTKGQWAALPERLEVRVIRMRVRVPGFRTTEITLSTTLLDEKKYPASAICELYLKRWRVELYFRDIKVTLGLDVLRCKSPEMVEKEIAMHAITYNAVRERLQEAAATHHAPLERLSFKGTVDTLREWASVFSTGKSNRKRERLYDQMLGVIAGDLTPERPHRSEPRVKKRRPKTYQLMTAPRGQMKVSKSRRNK